MALIQIIFVYTVIKPRQLPPKPSIEVHELPQIEVPIEDLCITDTIADNMVQALIQVMLLHAVVRPRQGQPKPSIEVHELPPIEVPIEDLCITDTTSDNMVLVQSSTEQAGSETVAVNKTEEEVETTCKPNTLTSKTTREPTARNHVNPSGNGYLEAMVKLFSGTSSPRDYLGLAKFIADSLGCQHNADADFWSKLIANSPGLVLPGLLEAILNKSIAETTVWIQRTPDLEACMTHLGQTPLHLAVVDDQILDLVLNSGHNVDAMDSFENTPLIYAIRLGRWYAVSRLLTHGASLSMDTRRTFAWLMFSNEDLDMRLDNSMMDLHARPLSTLQREFLLRFKQSPAARLNEWSRRPTPANWQCGRDWILDSDKDEIKIVWNDSPPEPETLEQSLTCDLAIYVTSLERQWNKLQSQPLDLFPKGCSLQKAPNDHDKDFFPEPTLAVKMHIALLHFLLVPTLAIAALNATPIPRVFLFALLAHQAWLTTQTIEAARLGTAAGFPSLDTHVADIAIKIAILVTLHMGVVLFLERIVLPKRDTWAGQVKEGYKMVFNGRRIGTTRLAPQVPILESEAMTLQQSQGSSFHDRVGTVRCEPRVRFVLRRLSLALLLALLEFGIKPALLRLYLPTTYDDFVPAKEVFFRRLLLPGRGPTPDAHEVAVRLWMTFETTWAAYSFYTMWHSLASAAAVAAGLDRPHEWPPLFGDIRQAYSLRRYWVKFFDRLIYRTMSGYAKPRRPGAGGR
ncbi:hypothetical protein HYQ46_003927 [Verticillium longisporum]|nr:hypothetical protein HYQ46_003927 [Verticillium longisporum]